MKKEQKFFCVIVNTKEWNSKFKWQKCYLKKIYFKKQIRDLNNTLTNVAPYNQLLHANKLIPTKKIEIDSNWTLFCRQIWENSSFLYYAVNSPKNMITGLMNESPEAEMSINAKTINIILITRATQPSVSPTFLPFELRASVIVMVLLNWFIGWWLLIS